MDARENQIFKFINNKGLVDIQYGLGGAYDTQANFCRKFADELIAQNLAHAAGLDTYRPGPSVGPFIKVERAYTEEEMKLMRTKRFLDDPFVCLSCYRDAKCLNYLQPGTLTVENLLQMLQPILEDPEPHKMCLCSMDDEGRKKCGGSGYIGTCPNSKQSINQKMRIEQFRLISAWMDLKDLYSGKAEWAQCRLGSTTLRRTAPHSPYGTVRRSIVGPLDCPKNVQHSFFYYQTDYEIAKMDIIGLLNLGRAEFGSPEVASVASSATGAEIKIVQQAQTCRPCEDRTGAGHHYMPRSGQVQIGRRKRYYICNECLRSARSVGQTPSGFSSKEIVLMICDLLSKEEAEERDLHCVCKNCLDNPESVISICRRAQSASSHSRKVNKNIELMAKWVKERDEKQRSRSGAATGSQRRIREQLGPRKLENSQQCGLETAILRIADSQNRGNHISSLLKDGHQNNDSQKIATSIGLKKGGQT
uniref:Uncharacterized protein n=1 Tax=Romanomermis culicivorax TaxID=13658 RepID=A0A915JFM7_ROMCU